VSTEAVYSIPDSEYAFERMLTVLRFVFTKDLKHIVSMCYRVTYYKSDMPCFTARQSLQTVQFGAWGEFPSPLGRRPAFAAA
jgi:hypothetical protein